MSSKGRKSEYKKWDVSLISMRKIMFFLWMTKVSIKVKLTTKSFENYDEFI